MIFIVSFLVVSSALFLMHESLRMAINSPVGMFEYMLLMSKEANFIHCPCGISNRSSINWTVFLTLYMKGRGLWEDSTFTSIWANLYPGAFLQFTTGLMGAPSL